MCFEGRTKRFVDVYEAGFEKNVKKKGFLQVTRGKEMPLLDCDKADCEWWGRCQCMLQVMVKQQQTKAKQVI